VLVGRWNAKAPPNRSPWAHVLATFGPDRVDQNRWRHLQRYVRPVAWIDRFWQP